MPHAVRPLLSAAAATLALGGCAQSTESPAVDFKGQEKLVANVVDDLHDAGTQKDSEAVCLLLASDLTRQIRATAEGSATCSEAVGDALDDADAFDLTVKSVKLTGDTATAVVESKENGDEIRDTLSFVKENGRWKISALVG